MGKSLLCQKTRAAVTVVEAKVIVALIRKVSEITICIFALPSALLLKKLFKNLYTYEKKNLRMNKRNSNSRKIII